MPEPGKGASGPEEGLYARRLKRGLDLAGAALMLVLLAPLLLGTAFAVALAFGRPVLFRQCRAGWRGQVFTILKLRSMRDPAWPGEPDSARLTRFGRCLRASGLDELPQLVNILRGEMSLVGPRPLPPAYTPLYTARQARRLAVRPGLLGPVTARGRNALPWGERLEWDAHYVARVTLAGDIAIILASLTLLLRGRGATAPGHASSPAFTGACLGTPPTGPSAPPVAGAESMAPR
ncbi:sugar transferase [Roseomonas gilardii subsp. gilardii]|uniref:sugar transferase n=1 Tax=Roseomonas gilardii TaxID=257708 RepID=UPI001FF95250|nr:sugar transferase [Roseomonas gilardii]UPG72740.1 sugar transferase [Roseomonas gilardii subsp. gilardii]